MRFAVRSVALRCYADNAVGSRAVTQSDKKSIAPYFGAILFYRTLFNLFDYYGCNADRQSFSVTPKYDV